MSIKKLFESTDNEKNYLSDTTMKENVKDVESEKNIREIELKQKTYVPQIDFSKPENFAHYGSAYLYYKGAIEHILDYYPYDGSDYEINKFYNGLLDIERYIFDTLYPRTTGYINISPWQSGWGAKGDTVGNYTMPATPEYITFFGGPNTSSVQITPNPTKDLFQYSNVYDEDIYTTAGLPSNYGSGSRTSNLRANFDSGVTIEFWLKQNTNLTAGDTTATQVVYDMWNSQSAHYPHYGRLTIEIDTAASASAFMVSCQSGGVWNRGESWSHEDLGFNRLCFGSPTLSSLTAWHHYAFVFDTSSDNAGGSAKDQLRCTLYVDGKYDSSVSGAGGVPGNLNTKGMMGRIGGLLTGSSGSANQHAPAGSGKLSGSIDEFRYWKTARTGEEIKKNWFSQVRGGVNTDLSNTTLGLYYKFNEGITTTSSVDEIVLDYGGRISNGWWTGYSSYSRNTGSAILSASAAIVEYQDPIIRSGHPRVTDLKTKLLETGSAHDTQHANSFSDYLPAWIIEEHEENSEVNNITIISHIVGTYFDKLRMMITELPKIKGRNYISSSYTAPAFSQHLPQSLGLWSPDIFIDSTVLERFKNRSKTEFFEDDLVETKNLIYMNLYNNLAGIFKAKGTEKSIRNVFRCFNVDERLIRLNTYSNNNTFLLRNNLKQTLINKTSLNMDSPGNFGGVVYQAPISGESDTIGYLSGSKVTNGLVDAGPYGFTMEADITFPHYNPDKDKIIQRPISASLFGVHTVVTASSTSLNAEKTTWSTNYGGALWTKDISNFQVYAIRETSGSKNVKFLLTSSGHFGGGDSKYWGLHLTSSTYFDVYANNRWNFSVRMVPSNYPITDIVSGGFGGTGGGVSNQNYNLIFNGYNSEGGTIFNQFSVTSSITNASGSGFLSGSKRIYAGAYRENFTGSLLCASDVKISGIKYWLKHLNDVDLIQHIQDINNQGASGSFKNISPRDPNFKTVDALNINTLALNWNFDNVTTSDSDGAFTVTDVSSGSATLRNNYGWIGKISGYQHTGYGNKFNESSTDVVTRQTVNSYKFVDPEMAVSSDMVQILNEDDKVYGVVETVPNFYYTLEKSMYNAISEEMLTFFAGVIDFNTLIGAPVNRYRGRYKSLEKLREIFFRKVTSITKVEEYIEYYKWFDDSIAQIVGQLLPASADFKSDILNTIESHVLERNKYRTKYPTLEQKSPSPEASFVGTSAALYPYVGGSPVLPSSPRSTWVHHVWWNLRAERTAAEISSGNPTVDSQRETIREIVHSTPSLSASKITISDEDGVTTSIYDSFARRSFLSNFNFDQSPPIATGSVIKGGVNFEQSKNLDFARHAVYPAGPVNTDNNVFVPKNILVAFAKDIVKLPEYYKELSGSYRAGKLKRFFKVNHGRDWEAGIGYRNAKSSISFPFNVMSSSVKTGFNKKVIDNVTNSIEITNLHNDTYGPNAEVPMQGPYTQHNVGGLQYRHIPINGGTSELDTYLTRPEGWKILLGTCGDSHPEQQGAGALGGISGAIGIAGVDYPWPEANDVGALPYPMTGSKQATYYRDHVAKRPVSIKNILITTASLSKSIAGVQHFGRIGNYKQINEVVHSVGAHSNPRRFVDKQPSLPTGAVFFPSGSQQVGNFLTFHRAEDSHFNFHLEYAPTQFTGSGNKAIFVNRFGAPGSPESSARAYQDTRGSEYSVYNTMNYRHITLKRNSQISDQTGSETIGTGLIGSRIVDFAGKDHGLRANLSRHLGRFGRDSLWVSGTSISSGPGNVNTPGSNYNQTGAFHRIHRNNKTNLRICNERIVGADPQNTGSINTIATAFAVSGASVIAANGKLKRLGPFKDSSGNTLTTKTFSFVAWVKLNATYGNRGTLWSVGDDGKTQNGKVALAVNIDSSERPELWMMDNASSPSSKGKWHATTALNTDTWYHLAVTYDGTAQSDISNGTYVPTFYINGVSGTMVQDSANNNPLVAVNDIGTGSSFIAATNFGNATSHYSLTDTVLDEVCVYDVVLTAKEVEGLYASGSILNYTSSFAPKSDKLCFWLRMGDHVNDPKSNEVLTASTGQKGPQFYDVLDNNHYFMYGGGGSNKFVGLVSNSAGSTNLIATGAFYQGVQEQWDYCTASQYNNGFVVHPIPRSERQYSWITSSMLSKSNINSFSYQRTSTGRLAYTAPYFSSSENGWVPYFTFMTGSDINIKQGSGAQEKFIQPTLRLNTMIVDPLSESNNTLGYPNSPESANRYLNSELMSNINTTAYNALVASQADYFNLLMTRRGNSFGWGSWKSIRQQDNAALTIGPLSQSLTICDSSDTFTKYRLTPVSSKAVPTLINFDQPTPKYARKKTTDPRNNITIGATHLNEKIFFDDPGLKDLFDRRKVTKTPAEQILKITRRPPYVLRWVSHGEWVWPSDYSAWHSSAITKISFDNKYWRDDRTDRTTVGTTLSNSLGIQVSQSSWPLDPPKDFLTRTKAPYASAHGNATLLRFSGAAGELQNTYTYNHASSSTKQVSGYAADLTLTAPGGVYARKHWLSTPHSVVAPSGIPINETSSYTRAHSSEPDAATKIMGNYLAYGFVHSNIRQNYVSGNWSTPTQMPIGAGEAEWDAGTMAGIITSTPDGDPVFEATASLPWWNNYTDFNQDLKLKAKDFSIIPEFRISKHVEDYLKYGINNKHKFDTYEIPGTSLNSNTASFYKDYSNSDFMCEFMNIKSLSRLKAKQIRLVCSASIRLNPYKGFYPAQRTLDLVSQFSKSYGAGIVAKRGGGSGASLVTGRELFVDNGGAVRPLFQALYSPGLLYNSIKSGMAIDYPVVLDPKKPDRALFTSSADDVRSANNWAICPQTASDPSRDVKGYKGGEYFDTRLPFETLLKPEKYIEGIEFFDIEPHPSAALGLAAQSNFAQPTASWNGTISDQVYSLMAENFFGESMKFFLKEDGPSKIKSGVISTDGITFPTSVDGEPIVYGLRIKMRRSMDGPRTYEFESGSAGNNFGYSAFGAAAVTGAAENTSSSLVYTVLREGGIGYSVPQDPSCNPHYFENFTLYSRPSAFGPPIAGRMNARKSVDILNFNPSNVRSWLSASVSGTRDCFNGFNWAYTPPYYHGESWCDVTFWPTAGKSYKLEDIISELRVTYRRVDPGPQMSFSSSTTTALIYGRTNVGWIHATNTNPIYAGNNVNFNAMQLSASLNLFGVEDIYETEVDPITGEPKVIKSSVAGKKWVIQPKWETPHMNFNDKGVRGVSSANETKTIPAWGSSSAPNGMWHQFGIIEPDPKKGIFYEIGDIPTTWLKYHPDVLYHSQKVYNNGIPETHGAEMYMNMRSLTDVVGFSRTETSKRMGELKDKQVLREAIVAVPYVINVPADMAIDALPTPALKKGKKFIGIPKERIEAASAVAAGSLEGDSLITAGASIRRLMQKMDRYVLPPQFDWKNNPKIDPMVMYIFEFEYNLDKDDLSYIWQNIAPRNYKDLNFTYQSVAHELMDLELLNEKQLHTTNLRWMVFKVKQKSQTSYYDLIAPQAGEVSTTVDLPDSSDFKGAKSGAKAKEGYKLQFNWPYDYISIVETAKIKAEVLYKNHRKIISKTGKIKEDMSITMATPGITTKAIKDS